MRRANFVIVPKAGTHFSVDELMQAMKRVKMRYISPLLRELRDRQFYKKPGEKRRWKSRRARVKRAKEARRRPVSLDGNGDPR